MASPVVWIRQLSGTSLDLSHSNLVRYRCYKRKSVGAHPVHFQICVLLLPRAYTKITWYMVCVCVTYVYVGERTRESVYAFLTICTYPDRTVS